MTQFPGREEQQEWGDSQSHQAKKQGRGLARQEVPDPQKIASALGKSRLVVCICNGQIVIALVESKDFIASVCRPELLRFVIVVS
jgi:hypothetical protein